ncbi:MAG: toll/interleukin-1 receptor domain-containing protein [Chloroflexi bacterium]|nr:toll/interleukin-1 receptor domain-containing protein [Chloroflexota bacterium]
MDRLSPPHDRAYPVQALDAPERDRMSYFFVSYSRHDRKKFNLDQVFNDLRAAGVPLWLVPDDVPPGIDWKDVKDDAIAGSEGLIYFSSRHINRTPVIDLELWTARRMSKPVFPVLLAGEPEYLPELYRADYIDFREDYAAGLKALIARLPKEDLSAKPVKKTAPKSKGYVFISYAEEDTAFVIKLRDYLKGRGYGYWDYQDSDRDYHGLLFLELEEVIKNAAATISVMSPDWKRSKWAAKEFLFSEEVGTPIFLLKVQEMEPTLVTAGIPYIDFTRDEQKGFDKLDNELRRKGLL